MLFGALFLVLLIVKTEGQNDNTNKGYPSSKIKQPKQSRRFNMLANSLSAFIREGRSFNQQNCDMVEIQRLLREDECKPRPMLLPVIDNNPLVAKTLPHHVVLDRCGGGMFDQQHGCIPTQVEKINIPITRLILTGNSANLQQECSFVPMEKHLACTHGCKLTAADCSPKQKFYPNECRCKCANQNEMTTCEKNQRKMWLEALCSCECIPSSKTDCSTGFIFDNKMCRCDQVIPTEADLVYFLSNLPKNNKGMLLK